MRVFLLFVVALAGCRRTVPIAADHPLDAAVPDVARVDADASSEPEPPSGGLAARLALGPYPSLEAACDELLDKCDPRYSDCECWGPHDVRTVGWLHVAGSEVSVAAPGGPNEEDATRHALIPASAGIWLARDGIRAG